MKEKEKPNISELDTRAEEDNKRTINRLLNLYDIMLDEFIILMQEPEYEGSPTYVEKLNLLKQLTAIVNPLMRRWNITHKGYDSSVRMAQAKQDSNTSRPQANSHEQNKTNEILYVSEIEPGVMEKITLSGQEEIREIVKVKEIEPHVFEVIDPPGQNEIIDLRYVINLHPDMFGAIKNLPKKEDESESTATVDMPTVNANAPDT
ncbi:MAG: hypothetical protein OXU23_26275 [Candidatus Poribacteria bacterium]|nr:hypothetical protein [Candidatus Poribacteria bacterium]